MDSSTRYYAPLALKTATLLVIENAKDVRIKQLCGNMTVGRNATGVENDIALASAFVGRNHGSFIYSNGAYYFKDNNSKNGTYINGKKIVPGEDGRILPVKLTNGDVIRLGSKSPAKAVQIVYGTTFSARDKWLSMNIKDKDKVAIGRNVRTGISLSEFMVSRDHATIIKTDTGVVITDNNSKNGVAVNKKMIDKEKELKPLDVIRIANTTMIYLGDSVVYNLPAVKEPAAAPAAKGTPAAPAAKAQTPAAPKAPAAGKPAAPAAPAAQGKPAAPSKPAASGKPAPAAVALPPYQEQADQGKETVMSVDIDQVRVTKHGSIMKKTLLKDIHLDIDKGEFILILGGSGAGKTTFIKALLGTQKAEGTVMLDGMDLYSNFKALKHRIGLVPQFSTTRDNDTVLHTITDAANSRLSGEYSKAEIKRRIDDVINKMMLTSLKNTLIKNLSGGQKKRVEVAIQAIGDQQVFVLDEPDSGLDTASRIDLMRNLKSCTESGGVVTVISHSPDDAAEFFSKIIVLAKSPTDEVGHLAFYGTVPEALAFFGVQRLSDIVIEINYEGSGKGRADEFIDKFARMRSMQ